MLRRKTELVVEMPDFCAISFLSFCGMDALAFFFSCIELCMHLAVHSTHHLFANGKSDGPVFALISTLFLDAAQEFKILLYSVRFPSPTSCSPIFPLVHLNILFTLS